MAGIPPRTADVVPWSCPGPENCFAAGLAARARQRRGVNEHALAQIVEHNHVGQPGEPPESVLVQLACGNTVVTSAAPSSRTNSFSSPTWKYSGIRPRYPGPPVLRTRRTISRGITDRKSTRLNSSHLG